MFHYFMTSSFGFLILKALASKHKLSFVWEYPKHHYTWCVLFLIFCRIHFFVAVCAHSDPFPAAFCRESSQKRSSVRIRRDFARPLCAQNVCGVRDAACAPYLHNVYKVQSNQHCFFFHCRERTLSHSPHQPVPHFASRKHLTKIKQKNAFPSPQKHMRQSLIRCPSWLVTGCIFHTRFA